MNQAEIIAMAKETIGDYSANDYWPFFTEELQKFAALVAAKERERFALECIDLVAFHGGSVELEAAIRARGQKGGV